VVVAIVNNKGGTGKTTTAVHLAAGLARAGRRVLLLDLDAQASASFALGVGWDRLSPSTADVLFGGLSLSEAARATAVPGLRLVPAEMDLASADLMLADAPDRERRLADALGRRDEGASSRDLVLLDCPPALSLLTVNALVAADRFIVPVTPEYLALEGLVNLMTAVDRIRSGLGDVAALLGILFTLVPPGGRAARDVAALVRERFGDRVFETEIRRDVRLAEAPAFGRTIFEHAPNCRGAEGYAALVRETIRRLEGTGTGSAPRR
jgi:chromosome partitioning protein